jgi:hypothetical protein
MRDIRIFDIANDEGRIMITNDKDFGEFVFYQMKVSQNTACGSPLALAGGGNRLEPIGSGFLLLM